MGVENGKFFRPPTFNIISVLYTGCYFPQFLSFFQKKHVNHTLTRVEVISPNSTLSAATYGAPT